MEKIKNLKVRLAAISLATACSLVALPGVAYAEYSDEAPYYEETVTSYSQDGLPIDNILEIHNNDDLSNSSNTNSEVPEESIPVDEEKSFINNVRDSISNFFKIMGSLISLDEYGKFTLGGAGGTVALYALKEIVCTVKEVREFSKEINDLPIEEEPQKISRFRKKKDAEEKSKKLR